MSFGYLIAELNILGHKNLMTKYKMTKKDKINGRQHITYSENSDQVEEIKYLNLKPKEAIGDFKNGELINGYYKLLNKEENDAYIVEVQDGEIFSKVDSLGYYIFGIRNKKQFNQLINSEICNVQQIIFHKTSYPSIFNSSFSQLSQYYWCQLIFIDEFLPTPEYNKYFLELIENLEIGAYLKSDFALMPALHFDEVRLSSEKDILLVNEFFKTLIKNIYLVSNYNPYSDNSAETLISQEKEEGDFSLSIDDKLIFESHKFNQKFDEKKLVEINNNENDESNYKAFIESYIDDLDFSKSLLSAKKAFDIEGRDWINIKFEVLESGLSWTYSQYDEDFNLDEEWKKKIEEWKKK